MSHTATGAPGTAARLMSFTHSSPLALASATVLLLLVRLGIAASAGLTEDEAYYRLWSLGFSLSYLDHPPMVAWLIAAGRAIAGEGELGVRFAAPILLAFGALLQWRVAHVLTDLRTAWVAASLFLAVPLLNIGGIIITPDLPSVLCFGLVVLGIAELERTGNANWWLAVGIFAGCGLLSKYTNLFAGATILMWLLLVPQNRKWFSTPQLWIGGAIALALSSPVLVWNHAHGWASFAKQFGRIGGASNAGLLHVAEMAAGLLALLSPGIAYLAAIGLSRVCRTSLRTRDSRQTLIAASIMPLLGYFAFHALHGRVQGNWLAPIYPMLVLCAALAIRAIGPRLQGLAYAAALSCGLCMTAAIYAHALAPLVTLRKDPTAQMRGWSGFAKSVEALATANEVHWIATSSYATTGQLAYAFRRDLPIAQLNERVRHAHLPKLPSSQLAQAALYIELDRRSNETLLAQCFSTFSRIATITRADGTVSGAFYAVYRVAGYRVGCAHDPQGPFAANLQE